MKKIIFYLIMLFGINHIVLADCIKKDSLYKCKKMLTIDDEGKRRIDLTCTLPNMPTFPITAEDVFNVDGSLHDFFGFSATDVCGVLGWMNNAIPHLDNFEGLKNDITTPLTLKFKHLPKSTGGTMFKNVISLDTDTYTAPDVTGNGITPDGNRHIHRMKYITVHEFLHFISDNSVHKGDFWVAEGTARAFEDMVYDSENPYADEEAYAPMYGERFIANTLEDLKNGDYKTFAFFKLLKDKCTLDMSQLLLNNVDISRVADNCVNLPNINEDQLASLFLYYNWAMLLKHDFSLIDSNEPVFPGKFEGDLSVVNNKNFKDTLDMKYTVNSAIAAYGAKSFFITQETLNSAGDMNLTFKSSGDLKLVAVRVKGDGSSNVNDNFVMGSDDTEYALTDEDRAGGLFVTIVNSTGKELRIEELRLVKKSSNTKVTLAFYYVYNCAGEIAGLKFKVYSNKNEEFKLIHTESYNNFYAESRTPETSWIIKDTNIFKDDNLYGSLGNETIGGWHGKVFFEINTKEELELLINDSWVLELYRYIQVDRTSGGWGGIGSGGHFIGGGSGDNCSLPVLNYKIETVRMPSISLSQSIIDKILEEF